MDQTNVVVPLRTKISASEFARRFRRLFTVGENGNLCCWGALMCEVAEPVSIARIVEALELPMVVCRDSIRRNASVPLP